MKILFTGGGSGGHFFPILAVIREVKKKAEENLILDLEIFYMGPEDNFGKNILKSEEVVEINVAAGKMRRYFSWENFSDVVKIAIGFLQALWNFFLIMPDVVFSKGGYGALPAVLASIIFRIPLIIHESDSVPGQVNKFSARFASRIGLGFSSASKFFSKNKTALVGVPVRRYILGGQKEDAREKFKIASSLPVVGFIGASQGAERINNAILGVLRELTEEFEVIHQTGAGNFSEVRGEAQVILGAAHKERYHIFGFLSENEMRDFYAACDLIVSRAGASSIFEIASARKPAIVVPLSTAAQNHQKQNAYDYAKSGAAAVVEEGNMTPHVLLGEVRKIMAEEKTLRRMAAAAQKFARPDSAEIIAKEILKLGIHN